MIKEEETLQKREFWGKLQSKIFTIQTLQISTNRKNKWFSSIRDRKHTHEHKTTGMRPTLPPVAGSNKGYYKIKKVTCNHRHQMH